MELKDIIKKYSLSNDFVIDFIKDEINRQALADLEGILRNSSVGKLESIIKSLSQPPEPTKSIPSLLHSIIPTQEPYTTVEKPSVNVGKPKDNNVKHTRTGRK
jgi:hypothetical protein